MKLKVKDKIFFGILIIGVLALLSQKIFFKNDDSRNDLVKVEVGQITLYANMADDADSRYQGLSGKESLEENQAMLFIHEDSGRHGYVMRGMNFDLDFIFIKEDKVVDIARNVSKNFRGSIQGATDYDQVLEVNADWTRRNNIQLGDEVKISR